MPTNNSASTITNLLESYISEKDNFSSELIIIDNKSSDETINIIENYSSINNTIRYISERDNGISDAFNKGVHYSKGEYILILGSDDILISGWKRKIKDNISLK